MPRKTKVMSFSLPLEVAEEIDELAQKEWQELFAFGERTAKRLGIKAEKELFEILNCGTAP